MIRHINTSTSANDNGIKCGVYAGAGHGKTALISTCPRPLIITSETKLITLQDYNIPAIAVSTDDDIAEAYNWATSSAEARNYDTICLDGISDLAETILFSYKKKEKDPRKAFYRAQEAIPAMVKSFRDIPQKNIYITGKMGSVSTVDGNSKMGILMPSKFLSESIPYLFDELFHIHLQTDPATQETSRWLRTRPNFQYDARDDSGRLEEYEPFVLGLGTQSGLGACFSKIIAKQAALPAP